MTGNQKEIMEDLLIKYDEIVEHLTCFMTADEIIEEMNNGTYDFCEYGLIGINQSFLQDEFISIIRSENKFEEVKVYWEELGYSVTDEFREQRYGSMDYHVRISSIR